MCMHRCNGNVRKLWKFSSHRLKMVTEESGRDFGSVCGGCSYSLADVCDGVHPAANANLIAYVWRVAELMHYSNVIGIRPLEELPFQCN